MATDDQMRSALQAARTGVPAKQRVTQKVTLTVAGNTTVKGNVVLPTGSDFRGITTDVPVAISGTPTSTLFTAGTADAGAQVVASVDVKAQGHVNHTIVAALNKGTMASLADTTVFFQIVTSGGTGSAGDVQVYVEYDAPVF